MADLLRGMTTADVLRSEKQLHDAFASIVIRLPQVQGVLLAGSEGEPLVSAGIYPVPKSVSIKDRDYYQAAVLRSEPLFVTAAQVGNVNQIKFIGLALPWKTPKAGHRA